MNILVTGANGQLGNEMRIVTKCLKDRYIFTDVCDEHSDSLKMLHKLAGSDIDTSTTKLDITNLDAIREMVKENDIKVIVNCAAWTNVDGAEDPDKYELVELLNAKAPENLAIAMKEVGGLLVHISTDYVFGRDPYNIPCNEDQKGTPTGVYGLTKLRGEQAIEEVACNHVILRTAWLYSEFGKNFVKTMLNLTATKPLLKVVFDQVVHLLMPMTLQKQSLQYLKITRKKLSIVNWQLSITRRVEFIIFRMRACVLGLTLQR